MKVSIVIPTYKEGQSVRAAYDEVRRTLARDLPDCTLEIIFVDDGSRDDTFRHLRTLAESDPAVRVIRFATNRGSHTALRAGFRFATGDCAAYLPCDLQEPPSIISQMLAALKDPVQVVWAVRQTRDDPWLSRLFSFAFYVLAKRLISSEFPPQGTGTFLLSRKVVNALGLFHERNFTLDGTLLSLGFPSTAILYTREARRYGSSKWTLAKKLKLFADFFVAHSYVPIRLMSIFGICVAGLGFLCALFLIINRILYAQILTGWTSLMVVVLLTSGLQMIMTGIIGEYLWRALDETRARPPYIVDCTINIDPAESAEKPGDPVAEAYSRTANEI